MCEGAAIRCATVFVCGILLGNLSAVTVVALDYGEPLAAIGRNLADPWGLVTIVESAVG